MVSHGEALPDHVGPDPAREIFADLDRDPATYLERFECRFLAPTPQPGFESLLLAVPLWRSREHDGDRVHRLASRAVLRYEELARTPPDPAADPYFAQRLADRVSTMAFIRDGLDIPAGPRWRPVTDASICLTAAPDGTAAIHVTRGCSCGETLSCTASVGARGRLDVAVRYDPDSPAMCTDCYPTSTSCTLPPAAPAAALPPRCP